MVSRHVCSGHGVMDRQFDILVFGATGFTGNFVAAELTKHCAAGCVALHDMNICTLACVMQAHCFITTHQRCWPAHDKESRWSQTL